MRNRIYIATFILLMGFQVVGQRKVVNQSASFSTVNQNMWGSGAAPGINTTLEIFPEYKQKLPFDTRDFTILEFEGLEFGAGIDGFVEFGVGPFQFVIEGFTLGEVDVNYPTNVSIDLPADNSFNSGETIIIKSSFQASPGAELITRYPSAAAARVALELGLLFDADLGLTGCLIDCLPRLAIVPAHTDPILDQDFKFFEVTLSELTYICEDPTSMPLPFQCTLSSGGPPWAFTDPKDIFTAEAELPFVVTNSQIVGLTDLQATGEHTYVNNSLNVIKLIGLIPVVAPFAEAIEGSRDIVTVTDVVGNSVSVTVSWVLVRITLNIPITHKQEFDFKPEIVTRLTFPDTVEYVVHSKTNGDQPGRAPFLEYQIGDSVSVNFPCEYDYMDVYATHRINNQFSNKTNDNIGLNLKFEALEFGLHIDPFIIIPEICIPIPFSDDLCVGPVGTPEVDETFGPLIDPDPIVLLDQDFPAYVDRDWELQGFSEFVVAQPFRLEPRKTTVDFVMTNIDCFGETTGTITTNFLNATEPVSYEWSFGSTAKSPTNVPAGTHQVKITDARGCVRFETAIITQPEIIEAQISATEITCDGVGESDISLVVEGGSGNYTFLWNTGDTTPSLIDQQAGVYDVTISDDNGCSIQKSITVDQPSQLVVEIFNPLEPSCNGGSDG